MQHDISIAERVQNLKQAASRRASRVSYLLLLLLYVYIFIGILVTNNIIII